MTHGSWQLLLITHTLLIVDLSALNVCFRNNITLKSGQPLNAGSKYCSSFNCIKYVKIFTIIAKTFDHICAQSLVRYHSSNENHYNIG